MGLWPLSAASTHANTILQKRIHTNDTRWVTFHKSPPLPLSLARARERARACARTHTHIQRIFYIFPFTKLKFHHHKSLSWATSVTTLSLRYALILQFHLYLKYPKCSFHEAFQIKHLHSCFVIRGIYISPIPHTQLNPSKHQQKRKNL